VVRKRQLVERCPEQVRGMGLRHRYTNAWSVHLWHKARRQSMFTVRAVSYSVFCCYNWKPETKKCIKNRSFIWLRSNIKVPTWWRHSCCTWWDRAIAPAQISLLIKTTNAIVESPTSWPYLTPVTSQRPYLQISST
jgi:hypothetical protein